MYSAPSSLAMFRWDSSKRQSRPLSRSKSTNSIPRSIIYDLHSDPATAEREAHIAARLSYQRAYGGSASEGMASDLHDSTTPSWRVCPTKKALSHDDDSDDDNAQHQLESRRDSTVIRRQRSIRFTGPKGLYKRTPVSRWSEYCMAVDNLDPSTDRGEHRGSILSSYNDGDGYLRSEMTIPSQYSKKGNAMSVSPFHKTMRKSKSWFNASSGSHRSGHSISIDGTPQTIPPHAAKENSGTEELRTPKLRVSQSMGLLPKNGNQTAFCGSRTRNDFAAKTVCEGSLSQVQAHPRHRLKYSPSLLSRTRRLRADVSTRPPNSLRNNSSNSASLGSSCTAEPITPTRRESLRTKARRASISIRSRIFGLLGGQSISGGSSDGISSTAESYVSKETVKATPREVKTFCSQTSTSFERGHCMGKGSRGFDFGSTGGQETVYDEEKSRVTSWADSVTSPAVSQMAIDWEDEKLPVISENAAQACNIESSGSTAFKIDSQRVYSALMKRVKENERRTVSGRRATTGAPSYDYNPTHQIVNCPNDHKDPQQYTIRHVRSDYNMFDDNWDGATSLNPKTPKIAMRSNLDMPYSLTSRRSSPNPWTEDVNVLSQSCSFSSPQASENDRRLVSERSSAFFASPTSHLFRTASPYRRALRESMKEAETAARTREAQGLGAGYLESLSAISLPTRRASTGFSERPVNMNYAESVYSDTHDSEANDSTSVVQKTPHLYGNEESFTEQSYPCYVNSHQCGSVSPLSFVEWKKTASLHAMGLEEVQVQDGEVPTPNLPRTFPIFSHVREHAEIDSTTELMTSSMTSVSASDKPSPPKYTAPISTYPNQEQWLKTGPLQRIPKDENRAPDSVQESPVYEAYFQKKSRDSVYGTPTPRSSLLNQQTSLSQKSRPSSRISNSNPTSKWAILQGGRNSSRLTENSISPVISNRGLAQAVEHQFGKTGMPPPCPVIGKHPSSPELFRDIWSDTQSMTWGFPKDTRPEKQLTKRMGVMPFHNHHWRSSGSGQGSPSLAFI